MASNLSPELIDVGAENIDKTGFFCYMSKKKTEGYQRKSAWLKARFAEGLQIKMLSLPERGFIEYIPGKYAWRGVQADDYMFIHCLWVVGKSKGKGFSTALLDACIADAKSQNFKGVAMVTSEKVWLAHRHVLDSNGFECVDTAPPSFSLMVRKFGNHPSPNFVGGWEKKAEAFGNGLTIIRSDQCPYIVDATQAAMAAAEQAGVKCRIVELQNRDDLLRMSPSAYGVFSLVLNGTLLSYHYQLEKDLIPLLEQVDKSDTSLQTH